MNLEEWVFIIPLVILLFIGPDSEGHSSHSKVMDEASILESAMQEATQKGHKHRPEGEDNAKVNSKSSTHETSPHDLLNSKGAAHSHAKKEPLTGLAKIEKKLEHDKKKKVEYSHQHTKNPEDPTEDESNLAPNFHYGKVENSPHSDEHEGAVEEGNSNSNSTNNATLSPSNSNSTNG